MESSATSCANESAPPTRSGQRAVVAIVLAFGAAKVALQLAAWDGDWFRDELYYAACARRLSWSYVDHPAFSILVLRAILAISDSLEAIRGFAVACGALTLVGLLLLARSLGARIASLVLAGLAGLTSPLFAAIHSFYSMNALEPLFWIAIGGLTVHAFRSPEARSWRDWLAIGAIAALGLHNKLSILWIVLPLCMASLWIGRRTLGTTKGPLLALSLTLLAAAPWLAWQVGHGFPTFEFVRNAAQLKMEPSSPLRFLATQLLEAGPLVLFLSVYGFTRGLRGDLGHAAFVLAVVVSANFALLALSPTSRAYHLVPAHCLGLALGARGLASVGRDATERRFLSVLAALSLLALPQVLALPLAIPLFGPSTTAHYAGLLPVKVPREERSVLVALPQHLADRHGWRELAEEVGAALRKLPPQVRGRTVVVTANYGQAAALERFLENVRSERVASVHNQYWYWANPSQWDEYFLLVGFRKPEVRAYFSEVNRLSIFHCLWCREDGIEVLFARGPVLSPARLWNGLRKFL